MIVDQAEKLRLMVKGQNQSAQVLAVTSGKGGVGKTNVAANLALCLMASRKNVILLDADLGLANLDVVLGMKTRLNLMHVISGQKHLDEIIETGPAGLKLISGVSGITNLADLNEFQRQRLIQEMTSLEHRADVIIVDTGAGISKNVLGFCDAADHTLVVTTPEPTSISDAYAVIKSLNKNRNGVKISLLVNMAESRVEAKKIYQRISKVASQFLGATLSDAGYILRDEHVPDAVCNQKPVVLQHPRCQASYCFMALAGKLARAAELDETDTGFFKKVVNWFF